MRKIKVLIVDDSAVVRKVLNKILSADENICVLGMANDPIEAKDLMIQKDPDVIILDLEMPRMDGLTFLKLVMSRRPKPVIVFSSISIPNQTIAMEALKLGAFEVLEKPSTVNALHETAQRLVSLVKSTPGYNGSSVSKSVTTVSAPVINPGNFDSRRTIVIGSSTGGTEALDTLLRGLPAGMPPIAIVQHIPEYFVSSLVSRLNDVSNLNVVKAQSGDVMQPGNVYISPGDVHLEIKEKQGVRTLRTHSGPKVHFQRPSVDVLFDSVTTSKVKRVIAVILTGMGCDGAQGMLKIKSAGGVTIAQNKDTCVVYGMPREAELLNAVDFSLPISKIPEKLVELSESKNLVGTN